MSLSCISRVNPQFKWELFGFDVKTTLVLLWSEFLLKKFPVIKFNNSWFVTAHMEEYWFTMQRRCAAIVAALIITFWRRRNVCLAFLFLKQVQSVVQELAFMILTASQLYVFWLPRDADPQNLTLFWIQKLFTWYWIQATVSISIQINWVIFSYTLPSCFISSISISTGKNYILYVHTEIQTYANVRERLHFQGKYMHIQKYIRDTKQLEFESTQAINKNRSSNSSKSFQNNSSLFCSKSQSNILSHWSWQIQ